MHPAELKLVAQLRGMHSRRTQTRRETVGQGSPSLRIRPGGNDLWLYSWIALRKMGVNRWAPTEGSQAAASLPDFERSRAAQADVAAMECSAPLRRSSG